MKDASKPKQSKAPADVVKQSAGAAAVLTPLLVYGAAATGHPLPPEMIPYVASAIAALGGWLHPDGKQ